MSNFKVQGNASGAGTFTLQSPNISGNLSLTMPAADGTSNQALVTNGSGVLSFASLTGNFVQIVSSLKTDTSSSAGGTTYSDTGVSATITPTSASNNIFVAYFCHINTGADVFLATQIVRGSTAIGVATSTGSRTSATSSIYIGSTAMIGSSLPPQSGFVLDSPATTSATTYKIQAKQNTAGTWYINRGSIDADNSSNTRTVSGIVLMEIAP